jgi:hypothetical protein
VRLTSGATAGGIVIAILIILSLYLYMVLHRRWKVIEIEQETIEEFDLPIEESKEIEISIASGLEEENCLGLEDDDENWGRGGDELPLHFDGDESFSALRGRDGGGPRVNDMFDKVDEDEGLMR